MSYTVIVKLGVLSIMPKVPEILVGSQMERSVSFRPEYSVSGPLDQFDQSDRSDRNLPFHFDKLVYCLLLLSRFHLCREFERGISPV